MLRELDALDADDAVRAGAILLDVREPEEYDAGHAPGARSVPVGELAAGLAELSSTHTVICVCRTGARSATAAEVLTAAGYDAVNLRGGMVAWASEGLPITTTSGAMGRVL